MHSYGVYLIFFICSRNIASGVYNNFGVNNSGTSLNEKFTNIDLSPTLRNLGVIKARASIKTSDKSDHIELHSKRVPLHLSENSHEINVGGMGLALSDRKPISLGHLSTKLKDNMPRYSQSSPNKKVIDGETWSAYNQLKYDYRIKRTMRNLEDPMSNKDLQPDITSRSIRRLWSLLQNMDDKQWTSEEVPRILRQRGVSGMMSDESASFTTIVDENLIRNAQILNFTFRDQSGSRFLLPESQVQIFRNWLVEQATCEMDFIWKDLGSLYWPRWIKMGVCLTRSGGSCSWPPGMKCQPSGSRVLRLLNWNCADTMKNETKFRKVKRSSRAVSSRQSNSVNSFMNENPIINLRSHIMNSEISSENLNIASRKDTRQLTDITPFRYPAQYYSMNTFWRHNNVYRRKDRRDANVSPAEEEDRKLRRAKRLIEKLSVNSSGFYCSWQIQKYLISDKCSCTCT